MNKTSALKEQLSAIQADPFHCYIFSGPRGSGKTEFVEELVTTLISPSSPDSLKSNVSWISSEAEGRMIKLDQVREVISSLSLKTLDPAQHRIIVFQRAEEMTEQSTNAVLKLLEEPPQNTTFILLTARLASILPTIRSRSHIIRFTTQTNFKDDTSVQLLASQFLQGQLTQNFQIAKQVHEHKQAREFLNCLFRENNVSEDKFEKVKLLLMAEQAINHNVAAKMVLEWLALEFVR